VDATSGVQVFLDDGDGVFNPADTMIYQGAGAALVAATFSTPLSLPVSGTAELWVRITFTTTAGQGAIATPETFVLAIAGGSDVLASTQALLGTPPPTGVTIGAIEFSVTSFSPPNDLPAGGKPISITGTGFVPPLIVKIKGVVCPGTPNIVGGTQVSGLTVPSGTGTGLAIEITSGTLPQQIVAQTFSYSKVGSVDGGSGGDSGSGCGAAQSTCRLLLPALLMTAVAGRRRRRSS
jgi:hypothetical protein